MLILSVPDEGYSSVPDEGYSSVPDEGYSSVPDAWNIDENGVKHQKSNHRLGRKNKAIIT